MRILEVLRKYYKENRTHKILYWIGLFVFAAFLAFIIEIGVFHINLLKTNRVTTDNFDDLVDHVDREYLDVDPYGYSVISDEALIRYYLKESYFINKFKINISSESGTPVYYSVYSYDVFTPKDNIMVPQTNNEDIDTVYMNEGVTTIEIDIVNAQSEKIKISISDFTYEDYFNLYRFIVLYFINLLLLINLSFIIKVFKFNHANILLANLIFLVPLYCYMVPPNYSWDEYDHLTRAIYIADGQFVYDKNQKLVFPYNYGNLQSEGFRSIEDYHEFMDDLENPDGGYLQKEARHYDTSARTYIFVPYLFSALGIKIAQWLNLNGFYYLVLARLCNGIVYTIAATIALRLFPINKKLFLFLALVPFSVFVVCSPSISSVLISSMLLLLSIVAYYKRERKKMSTPMYLFLLFLTILIIFSRITYAFLIYLLCLIPRRRFKNRFIGRFNFWICTLIFLITAGGTYIYSSQIGGFYNFNLHQVNIDPARQLKVILTKPITYIRRVWNATIVKYITPNLGTALVDTVYNGALQPFYGLVNIILLTFLTLSGKKNLGLFNNFRSRFIMFSIFILIYVGTITSMYMTMTDVDSGNILGVQQRYILPLLITVLPCIQGKHFYLQCNEIALENINVLYLWLLNTLILLMMVARYYS